LIGNEIDNFFHGGKGNDIINGNAGSDTVSYSNATSVSINLANSLQQNTFGAGLDTLIDIENLIGSNFADLLTGNAEDNLLVGGLGSNRLNGGGGNDTVSYTFAHQAITGSLVTGIVRTTSGIGVEVDDRLTSIENLTGTYFDDNLFGNIGNNILNGSSGIDTVSYEFAKGGVTVNLGIIGQQNTIQAGFDSLISIENLTGSDFNDTLIGNSGNNLLVGGLGNDVLKGSGGIDTISYKKTFQGNSENVLVDLSITTQQNTGIYGFDTLIDIENVNGTSQNDTLLGNSEDNVLNGEGGNDILNGKDGNDTLIGGIGSIFVFDTSLNDISNNDKIQSFYNVSNEIHLDNAIFAQLTILGKLSAENFVSGVNAIALDSNDFIIFDLEHNDKGTLYYDADGSGAGKQVEFVTLTGVFETFRFNPLTANEFVII
jgi:Ca2+-binding RTX toxin-like protein